MSKSYSTASSFHSLPQEQKIRSIIQQQIYDFFSTIKDQIQRKIKKIDVNIQQLKLKIDQIHSSSNSTHHQFHTKTLQIEKTIQNMKQTKTQQILQLLSQNTSRSRSLDKEKSNLFRKSPEATDISKLLFGEEIQTQRKKKTPEKKPQAKPPLPKQIVKAVEIEKKEEVIEVEVQKGETLLKNLNKNKNSFMRKKSEKQLKTYTIQEEQIEQSIINNQ